MEVLSIRQTVKRACQEGYHISEYSLRKWVRSGAIPVRRAGNKILIYYPNIILFLQGRDLVG